MAGRAEGSPHQHARMISAYSLGKSGGGLAAADEDEDEEVGRSPRRSAATVCIREKPAKGSSRVRHSHMTTPKEYTSTAVVYLGFPSKSSGAMN